MPHSASRSALFPEFAYSRQSAIVLYFVYEIRTGVYIVMGFLSILSPSGHLNTNITIDEDAPALRQQALLSPDHAAIRILASL